MAARPGCFFSRRAAFGRCGIAIPGLIPAEHYSAVPMSLQPAARTHRPAQSSFPRPCFMCSQEA